MPPGDLHLKPLPVNQQTDASKALVKQIAALRLEGKAFSSIGVELGITKNAGIGLIHRHRPDMVQRKNPMMPRQPHAYERVKPTDCQWPLGDPRHRDFAFCGERRKLGRPYCAKHSSIAYVKGSTAVSL